MFELKISLHCDDLLVIINFNNNNVLFSDEKFSKLYQHGLMWRSPNKYITIKTNSLKFIGLSLIHLIISRFSFLTIGCHSIQLNTFCSYWVYFCIVSNSTANISNLLFMYTFYYFCLNNHLVSFLQSSCSKFGVPL